jgi:hypothetical protein
MKRAEEEFGSEPPSEPSIGGENTSDSSAIISIDP